MAVFEEFGFWARVFRAVLLGVGASFRGVLVWVFDQFQNRGQVFEFSSVYNLNLVEQETEPGDFSLLKINGTGNV